MRRECQLKRKREESIINSSYTFTMYNNLIKKNFKPSNSLKNDSKVSIMNLQM